MRKKLLFFICILLLSAMGMKAEDPITNWAQVVEDYNPATNVDDDDLKIDGNSISIKSGKGLAWLAKETNKGGESTYGQFVDYKITLENDIDLSEYDGNTDLNWTPIGYTILWTDDTAPFSGSFDGQGFTISNLHISSENITGKSGFTGLFGFVKAEDNNEIKNLNLASVNVNGANSKTSTSNTAALIALAKGSSILTLTNCHVLSGSIKGGSTGGNFFITTAGLVADLQVDAVFKKCSNSATIYGGIGVTDNFNFTAGLAARINNLGEGKTLVVEECFNNGSVNINSPGTLYMGGLFGWLGGKGTISNCYNNGTLTIEDNNIEDDKIEDKQHHIGGIAGVSLAEVKNSYATGNISVPNGLTEFRVAGIFAHVNQTNIENCLVALTLFPEQVTGRIGRIYGGEYGTVTFSNNYAYIPGTTAGTDDDQNGAEWDGKMSLLTESLSWDDTIWDFSRGDDYMPRLKNISADFQPLIPNPLSEGSTPPVTYHTVTLEVAPGIDLHNLTAGNHTIEEGGHLQLQFLPEDRTATAADVLFLVDGVETAFKDFGGSNYFSYILSPIKQDHSILIAMKEYTVTLPNIEGVTIDVGPGEHAVAYGDSFTFSLTLDDGIDPAMVHVYVNGTEVMPEPLRATTLVYTIDKVIGPITIEIEGAGDPVGNIQANDAKAKVYATDGCLMVETSTLSPVRVYMAAGKLVANRMVNDSLSIYLPAGIYLVQVGREMHKVVVY